MQTFGRPVAAVAALLEPDDVILTEAGCISASYGLGSQGREGRPLSLSPSNHPLETFDALGTHTGTKKRRKWSASVSFGRMKQCSL